jgi:protein phosphatase
MGGHQGGEIASRIAAERIPALMRQELKKQGVQEDLSPDPLSAELTHAIEESLRRSISEANREIHAMAQKTPSLQGMGTTTTALLLHHDRAWVGHVGDSRCYFLRPGENSIWQLTRDHSWVQEKLRAGLITRSQLKSDRMRNVITRSVGFDEKVDVDVYSAEVQPGDVFILCSDGLTGHIDDTLLLALIRKTLSPKAESPAVAATELIDEANRRGGDDNITAIVVRIPE